MSTMTISSQLTTPSYKGLDRCTSAGDKWKNISPPPPTQDSKLKRLLNSNRTGGPRTSKGRARIALNSIKHGNYVTTSSAGTEFQSTLRELIPRINPVGVIEEGVVNSLTVELCRV
jgi:hypothetical protein